MEYLPYGETWFQEDQAGVEGKNIPKYNSQELDKETGYYFYNARHYDPEIARFVTPDTVIDEQYSTQGWNRFAYCHGNPIVYRDPTGHNKLTDFLKGVFDNVKQQGSKVAHAVTHPVETAKK
jgi:RHS repeat-associated protein